MCKVSVNIYPKPKKLTVKGEKIGNRDIRLIFDSKILEIAEEVDFPAEIIKNPDASLELKVYLQPMETFRAQELQIPMDISYIEPYGMVVKGNSINIYADSNRACYYGILTLKELVNADCVYDEMCILDYPHMKIRGIIEGFYGKPWSAEERVEAITTVSSHRMNSYIYAPKNDPHHREKWHELYSQEKLLSIKELFQHCKKRYVDFYFTVGPGLSMKYSNKESFCSLFRKYTQLFEIGVRHFGIFFDDIPLKMLHQEDRDTFADLAEAHGFVINELYKGLKNLDKSIRLLVCGTVYSGKGNEEYTVKLASMIPQEVHMFWTGRSICSQELDSRDAGFFCKNTLHKPLYWDNYPVNDANMQRELHLGPLINRDRDLYKYSEGLVVNVMEYKEASMIPVITACHYLWDCENYDSYLSLENAVREVVGAKDYKHFIRFNKYCLFSCLTQMSSQEFFEKVVEFKCAGNKSREEFLEDLKKLEEYFRDNVKAAAYLRRTMINKKLLKEIKPWLAKFMDFNSFCALMIKYMFHSQEKRRIKGAVVGLKILLLYRKLKNNPIQMMNFETQVLMESGGN
jgi:hyaluronoglucosaminidase